MGKSYDVAVIGLGAMGASVLYQLAQRGAKVIGFDRDDPPHAKGSSHGETRITRLAIGEGAAYTPLAMRSHELWREMERTSSVSLFQVTGGLIISSDDVKAVNHVPGLFSNTVAEAERNGIRHEILTGAEIHRRFPPLFARQKDRGYYEPDAGFLRPEMCVRVQIALARARGAEIVRKTPVIGVEPVGSGVNVLLKEGEIRARRAVICAGPWIPKLLGPRYAHLFSVRRQVQHWFDIEDAQAFRPGKFPVFYWEMPGEKQGMYGFPAIDGRKGGVKVATEQVADVTDPDRLDRHVGSEESHAFYEGWIRSRIVGVSQACLRSAACMYTVTPDSGFIVDAHPEHEAVTILSACSGHGFKHSAALGEAVAERLTKGESRIPLDAFRIGRFAQASA